MESVDSSLDSLKNAMDKLRKGFEELGQEAMKGAGPVPNSAPSPENPKSGDEDTTSSSSNENDVVDADFEVVDDDQEKK